MELLEIMQNRRSIRQYTGAPIPEDAMTKIVQAGLLSPSSCNRRPWELIVVKNKETLEKMATARTGAANMLTGAAAAIVVLGDETVTDVWTEDCSIVMASMHLMASSLGIGSCWIQGRNREAADGSSSEEYLRELLHFPQRLRLEAILSLGMPAATPAPHSLEELKTEKVHEEAMDAHLLVNVRYTLKTGTREEFLKKFEEIEAAPCSRKEPGNLRYDYFCPEDDADAMCLIEEWTDTEAQKIHGATPHYQKLAALKKEYVLHMDLVKTYIDPIPPAVTSE